MRDAYVAFSIDEASTWILRGGYGIFNWSVLEAFHPTSGLHSLNYASSQESREKFGELALTLEKGL